MWKGDGKSLDGPERFRDGKRVQSDKTYFSWRVKFKLKFNQNKSNSNLGKLRLWDEYVEPL